jgi:predicted ABC-type exoprotein transport system permease subunit
MFSVLLQQHSSKYSQLLQIYHHHHHHKHPGLSHLARSVSIVKVALSIVSLVSQLFSFRVGCKGMILKGFGFVAFFAGVKAGSFCIRLSCLVCSLSVVGG